MQNKMGSVKVEKVERISGELISHRTKKLIEFARTSFDAATISPKATLIEQDISG